MRTQAVGLIYADKARFRSHALVRIGPPEGVEQWAQAYEDDPVAAVRALTDRLGQQLAAVAPMYDSRQDELAYRRVASIAAHDPAAQDDVARALGAAAQQGPAAAAEVAELTATSQRYESDLALLGLSDDDLARGLTPADYKRRISHSALTAAVTAPLAAIGAVIHFVPYQIMKQVGKRPSEGMRATVKLLGCTALFTAVYSAIGIRAGRRRGLLAGLAGFLIGPLSGYVTVRWSERMDRLGGLAQARAVMAERGDVLGDLAARRADVVARHGGHHRPGVGAGASRSLTSTRTRSSSSGVSIERPWPPPGSHHSGLRLARPGEQRLGVLGTEHPLLRVVRDDDETGRDGRDRAAQVTRLAGPRIDPGAGEGEDQGAAAPRAGPAGEAHTGRAGQVPPGRCRDRDHPRQRGCHRRPRTAPRRRPG